jgi:Fe-S cluster biogenesis protein NfuA
LTESLYDKINEIIKNRVQPALERHNGGIDLLEVTPDGFVKVKLTGACSSCPDARQTLAEVVETALREAYPELKGVIPVYQVSDELIQEALKIIRNSKPQH